MINIDLFLILHQVDDKESQIYTCLFHYLNEKQQYLDYSKHPIRKKNEIV